MKNQAFYRRVGFAFQGLRHAIAHEHSIRLQCIATLAVLAVLIWRRPQPLWWAILAMMCAIVISLELINSSLEAALDHLHPQFHAGIGVAKDCAAAAVMVASVASVAVFTAFLAANF